MAESESFVYSAFADELRVKGIRALGYGIVPKAVMLDPDLSVQAKAIYAYFCSYSGSGNTLFPTRDRIVDDLGVNKDTYYKHFSMLSSNGYITTVQSNEGGMGHGFSRNIYVIEDKPPKYTQPSASASSVIRNDGLLADGYGMYPKTIAKDTRLSIQAKALYAYYAVYAGAGDKSWPAKDTILKHLGISDKSFRNYKNELIDANYITETREHVNGKLGASVITLITNPDEEKSSRSMKCVVVQGGKFSDTQISADETQSGKIWDTQAESSDCQCGNFSDAQHETGISGEIQCGKKQDTQKQDTQISDTLSIDRINNTGNNSILLNYQSETDQKENETHSLTGEEITEVLLANSGIPADWLGNTSVITAVVKHLMSPFRKYVEVIDKVGYGGIREHKEVGYFESALTGMLSASKGCKLGGSTVYPKDAADRLAPYILNGTELSEDLIMTATDKLFMRMNSTDEEELRNPVAYMMTIIWNIISATDYVF